MGLFIGVVGAQIIESEIESKVEIVRAEFDIITSSKETYRQLHSGYDYALIAFGDNRIKDIDIIAYKEVDGNWIEIAKDNSSTEYATLEVTPTYTGLYKIKIEAYEFETGYEVGFYSLIIAHD